MRPAIQGSFFIYYEGAALKLRVRQDIKKNES